MAEFEARFSDDSVTWIEAANWGAANEELHRTLDEWAASAGWGTYREARAKCPEYPRPVRLAERNV